MVPPVPSQVECWEEIRPHMVLIIAGSDGLYQLQGKKIPR